MTAKSAGAVKTASRMEVDLPYVQQHAPTKPSYTLHAVPSSMSVRLGWPSAITWCINTHGFYKVMNAVTVFARSMLARARCAHFKLH